MWKVIVVFVVAAAGVVGWLVWQQNRQRPLVVSGFIEADQIRVGSRVGGRVAEVVAREGQRLKAGEPLYRIEPFDLREKLSQAQAHVDELRAELAKLKAGYRLEEIEQAAARRERLAAALAKAKAGPRPKEIEIAEQQLRVARANLELAQSEYARVVPLAEQGTASQNEIDEAKRALTKALAEVQAAELALALLREGTRQEEIAEAQAALAEAEAALKLLKEGYRPQEIDQAAARLAAAEADVRAIQEQIDELTVTSPCDCTVEALDLRPGDIVAPNAPTASVLETDRMWVRAYVPESRLSQVALNRRVHVRIDGLPDRGDWLIGRITYIASEAEFTPRNVQTPEERSKQVFRVKITLETGREKVHVGMMGDVLLDEPAPPTSAN